MPALVFIVPSSLFRKTTPAKSRHIKDCKLGIERITEKQKRKLAEKDIKDWTLKIGQRW